MGGVEGGRSSSKTLPEMSITSDEVNFLVYRYLQESGAWPRQRPFAQTTAVGKFARRRCEGMEQRRPTGWGYPIYRTPPDQGRFARSCPSTEICAEKADQVPWRHALVKPHASDDVDACRTVATAKRACSRQWVGATPLTREKGRVAWRGGTPASRVALAPLRNAVPPAHGPGCRHDVCFLTPRVT